MQLANPTTTISIQTRTRRPKHRDSMWIPCGGSRKYGIAVKMTG
jgi:hypothetical protein